LTIDTSAPLTYSSSSGGGTFNTYAGQNTFAVIFNSNSYTLTEPGIAIQDRLPGQGQDAVSFGMSRDTNYGGYESFGLVFADPSATALSDNHIPSSLTAFPQGTFRLPTADAGCRPLPLPLQCGARTGHLLLHAPRRQRNREAEAAGRSTSTTIFMRAAKKRMHCTSNVIADGEDVVDIALDDREGQVAQVLGLRAVGDRLRRVDVHDGAAAERLLAVVAGLRLHAIQRAILGDNARVARAEPLSRPPPPRQTKK
jgi:hypothetical protein